MNSSLAVVVALLLALTRGSNARLGAAKTQYPYQLHTTRRESQLLTYHEGPLLTNPGPLNVYLIWYGDFLPKDRAAITDFFASFSPSNGAQKGQPTVSKWWHTTRSYKDKAGDSVPGTVRLAKQLNDGYSLGKKTIKRAQIADLVQDKIDNKFLPKDPDGIYLVLTSKDVTVERFCMSSCGFHGTTFQALGSAKDNKDKYVIAHVGDPTLQCPGFCAWPYAVPPYGPPFKPLPAPNGVGADGMVINIATALAGAATNPFNDGYYQGDVRAPLEAVSACSGKYGAGAFPGFPGKLLSDPPSNVTYNAFGANGRKFLLPAMWDLTRSSCKVVS